MADFRFWRKIAHAMTVHFFILQAFKGIATSRGAEYPPKFSKKMKKRQKK